MSLSGVLMGTPAYMAPERFDGHGDHRSDVYALGCVLHEMLTGRKPFTAEGIWAWGTAHRHAPPPRPSAVDPALPPGLDDVVARALAKDPDARFRSAGELAAATAGAATRVAARWAPAQGVPTFVPAPAPPGVPPPRVPGGVGATPRATPLLLEAPPTSGRSGARRWAVPVAALAAAVAVVAGVVLVDGRGGTTGFAAVGQTTVPTTPVATATARPSQSAAPGVASSAVRVGDNPWTVTLAPDGMRAFTADDGSGTVSVIDTGRRAVTATVPVGGRPADVALSPDGTRAYVADLGVHPAKGDTVRVIDTAAGTVVDTITVGSLPADVAVTPDGRQLYVAASDANTVSVVDTATHRVVGSVPTSSGPNAVAFSPDGRRAYVSNFFDGTVAVIDTAMSAVVATRTGYDSPDSVAVSPDGRTLYVAENGAGRIAIQPAEGG